MRDRRRRVERPAVGFSAIAHRALELNPSYVAADVNLEAARQLAALLREAGVDDPGQLRRVYQRIAAIDPYDAEAHGALGRLALQRNDPESAAREFRTVLALGPVDEATARCDLADRYLRGGRRAAAKKQALAALEIAPTVERAQTLLLTLVEELP